MIQRKGSSKPPELPKEVSTMVEPSFVHLHVHDDYSILDGLSTAEEYVDKIIEENKKSGTNRKEYLCITNHGMLSQVPSLYKQCERALKEENVEIVPIYGCEIYLNDDRSLDNKPEEDKEKEIYRIDKLRKNSVILILAKNEKGWKKLIKVSSDAWINGFYDKPRIDHKTLKEIYGGEDLLFGLSGVETIFAQKVLEGKAEEAEEIIKDYKESFGDDLFLAISLIDIPEQHIVNQSTILFASKYEIPIVLTNNVHYARPDDAAAQRVFLLLQAKRKINQYSKEDNFYRFHPNSLWYKTEEELDNEFATKKYDYISEDIYKKSKENSVIFAKKCKVKLDTSPKIPAYNGDKEGYKTADEYLRYLAYKGLEAREKKDNQEYIDRMELELDVISRQKYSDYFLIVWDMVVFAHKNDINVGPGRGCFVPGTEVFCGKESKSIEKIKIGDKVSNFYHGLSTVINKFEYDILEELIEIEFENNKKITCTKDHNFLTQKGMIAATNLLEVHCVIKLDGSSEKLKNKNLIPYKGKVYDLMVDSDDHTYNVDGFVVHNSAAGSLLTYCLGITDVDPIQHYLFFERFLNEARKDMPDIDVDYEPEGRDKIKNYIIQKYGEEYTCSIGVYGSFKTRAAINDVCRTFGASMGLVKEINDKIMGDVDDLETREEVEKAYGKDLTLFKELENHKIFDSLVNPYEDIFWKLRFKMKTISSHAAGFIISSVPLKENLPIITRDDVRISAWIEGRRGTELSGAGFVKWDILGLLNLTFIRETIKLVKERHGIELKTTEIDSNLDDPNVYKDLRKGNALLIFQFESNLMMSLLRKSDCDSFQSLAAITAIGRPGPMMSGMTEEYCKRKTGEVPTTYDHPILEKVLGYSYGLPIYQEQVMQLANQIGGFTMSETDTLRKDLVKLKGGTKADQQIKLNTYKQKFIDGGKCYLEENKLDKMFEDFKKWSSYGFNRCLCGDTVIYRASGNQNTKREVTIKELYDIKKTDTWTGQKYRTLGFPKILAMVDGKIRIDKLKEIYFNGIKDVYEIITEKNNKIKATKNHKFLCEDGWKSVEDFKENDEIAIMGGYITHGGKKLEHIKWIKEEYEGQKGGIGFPVGSENPAFIDGRKIIWVKNRKIKQQLKNCETCGDEHRRLEVHHKNLLEFFDNDHTKYNDLDNLIILCPSCHKKEHYKNGRTKRYEKGRNIVLEKIVSIKYVGQEETYDVEMEGDEHNFVANNFISHNSHAVSYTVVSFRCAWLKTYYPIEYVCSVLRNISKGDSGVGAKKSNKYERYIFEAKRLGIDILPVDINKSKENFTIEGTSLRIGFSNVKGVGEEPALKIVELQPFKDFDDFLNRCVLVDENKISKRVILPLILVGAFEEHCGMMEAMVKYFIAKKMKFEIEYKKLLTKIDPISERICTFLKEITKNFTIKSEEIDLEEIKSYEFSKDDKEKFFEYEFGFHLNHPLAKTIEQYKQYMHYFPKLKDIVNGVCVGKIRSVFPSKQKKVYFLILEDGYQEEDKIKIILWANIYKKLEHILTPGKVIICAVKKNEKYGSYELFGMNFSDIKNIPKVIKLFEGIREIRERLLQKKSSKRIVNDILEMKTTKDLEVGDQVDVFCCYLSSDEIKQKGGQEVIGRKLHFFDQTDEFITNIWNGKMQKFMEEIKAGDKVLVTLRRDEDYKDRRGFSVINYKKYVV